MLSSSNIKLINSLRYKKYRDRYNLFVIEGDKLVNEFLESEKHVKLLLATSEWIEKTDRKLLSSAEEIIMLNDREIKKISQLKTPQNTLALVNIEKHNLELLALSVKLNIGLENIQDPGNLGTIIRVAAWFGIDTIICSNETVDVYNPKTIQASMGAILHVKVFYTNMLNFLNDISKIEMPVFAATLDGVPIQEITKTDHGLLLFGNESKGLSANFITHATHKIKIPAYGQVLPGIESLNVAMSAAIICNEFRRDMK
ncbi:MAG TPA: RNA methyltransferase [Bacteroidales bacterium]|nr:RNA methyltransferase [Bacteroidales bacterium]